MRCSVRSSWVTVGLVARLPAAQPHRPDPQWCGSPQRRLDSGHGEGLVRPPVSTEPISIGPMSGPQSLTHRATVRTVPEHPRRSVTERPGATSDHSAGPSPLGACAGAGRSSLRSSPFFHVDRVCCGGVAALGDRFPGWGCAPVRAASHPDSQNPRPAAAAGPAGLERGNPSVPVGVSATSEHHRRGRTACLAGRGPAHVHPEPAMGVIGV
jgi:hypothetical protein